MDTLSILPEEKGQLKELLKKYYGIGYQFDSEISFDLILSKDGQLSRLQDIYSTYLGTCPNDGTIIKVMALIALYYQKHLPVADEEAFHNAIQRDIRQDLLRLYIFCEQSMSHYEGIGLRSSVNSIRLTNSCNWLWNDLIKDYLKANIPDITSAAQAKDELIRGKSKRGRQPKDARIQVIIWGTFRLLTDLHGFETPMPNSLCDFLVKLLQNMEIIPENTEIDKYWIRAELRYISSSKKINNKLCSIFTQK